VLALDHRLVISTVALCTLEQSDAPIGEILSRG
jgi:hypothetical protein